MISKTANNKIKLSSFFNLFITNNLIINQNFLIKAMLQKHNYASFLLILYNNEQFFLNENNRKKTAIKIKPKG